MVRLVFRPYTQIWRSICTSDTLRASIRVSSDFTLFRHSSPSFGSQQIRSYSNLSKNIQIGRWCICDCSSHILTFYFHFAFVVCHPKTRAYVRLLGPCFKTGRLRSFCQHPECRVCWSSIYHHLSLIDMCFWGISQPMATILNKRNQLLTFPSRSWVQFATYQIHGCNTPKPKLQSYLPHILLSRFKLMLTRNEEKYTAHPTQIQTPNALNCLDIRQNRARTVEFPHPIAGLKRFHFNGFTSF